MESVDEYRRKSITAMMKVADEKSMQESSGSDSDGEPERTAQGFIIQTALTKFKKFRRYTRWINEDSQTFGL